MSLRAWRWALWLSLLATAPVPILIVGPGYVPVLRMLMLALATASVLVFEHWGGAVPLLVLVFVAQCAFYGAILWLVARVAVSVSVRCGRPGRILVAVIVALLVAASSLNIYRDPYQASSPDVNLARVYQ